MGALPPLLVRWLGRVAYAEGLRLQDEHVQALRSRKTPGALLLLEHPPVITLGRGADRSHVLLDERERAELGIELHECGRGGDVTFHGPGQLVGYPILELPEQRRDVHAYLRDLEEALIRTVADFGVEAGRVPGLTGIWVGQRKLAAIGVRVSTGWITSHGFALNAGSDLAGFNAIIPCGLAGRGVTSLAELTGRDLTLELVAARAAVRMAEVLGYRPLPSVNPCERLAFGATTSPDPGRARPAARSCA
jgi:lipoyl(octanoyl) transferase